MDHEPLTPLQNPRIPVGTPPVLPLIHDRAFVIGSLAIGRPANTCEAHRSRQQNCPSCCLILSARRYGLSLKFFLLEMCIGSPLLVREPTSFQIKEETRWLPTKNPLIRC